MHFPWPPDVEVADSNIPTTKTTYHTQNPTTGCTLGQLLCQCLPLTGSLCAQNIQHKLCLQPGALAPPAICHATGLTEKCVKNLVLGPYLRSPVGLWPATTPKNRTHMVHSPTQGISKTPSGTM